MKIAFIGSGNLAWHISKAFQDAGAEIIQVFSRTEKNAKKLADMLNTCYTTNIVEISPDADLYVFAVSDEVLIRLSMNELIREIIDDKLVVHTAGSVELSVLKPLSKNYGVFYPFQTFSKNTELECSKIPICYEANTDENNKILKELAEKISTNVQFIDTEQRKYIHLAGVFACNFTNHMYALAEKILNDKKISAKIMMPLINETAKKVNRYSAKEVQTGPVVRNDEIIIKKHLELLGNYPDCKNLYTFVSDNIKKFQKK